MRQHICLSIPFQVFEIGAKVCGSLVTSLYLFLEALAHYSFQLNWGIEGPGTETFSATVYDAVGNSASAEVEVTILRSGS